MKIRFLPIALLCIAQLCLAGEAEIAKEFVNSTAICALRTQSSSMPLFFTKNQGQWDGRAVYMVQAGDARIWFCEDGVYYQFLRSVCEPVENEPSELKRHRPDPAPLTQMVIKAQFIGANSNPSIVGGKRIDYECNYIKGNDPAKWQTHVPNYESIVYYDIYAGIDLKYYGNGSRMEYDFAISADADPSQIRIRYDGALSLSVNRQGHLLVETAWGLVSELKPLGFQGDSRSIPVSCKYVLLSDNTFGFEVGDEYDPTLPLLIDPIVDYNINVYGSQDDYCHDIAVDDDGCAYICGYTQSMDFPVVDPHQDTINGDLDIFITKINPDGSALLYSTFLGGNFIDIASGIAVDDSGNMYIAGHTSSADYPLVNPIQSVCSGFSDVCVSKISGAGDVLIYSTYLGGDKSDFANAIAIDAQRCAYVTGETWSDSFPTVNPMQPFAGIEDAFVSKLSISGDALVYSTFLGGMLTDFALGIAVDSVGGAVITGCTDSPDFPLGSPLQPTYGGGVWDIFVTKINGLGNEFEFSTYLGGDDYDHAEDVTLDDSGYIYLAGFAVSTNYPTLNAFQDTHAGGGQDAIVSKIDKKGEALIYSTYLGGEWSEFGYGIAVDRNHNAYITGSTGSRYFPMDSAFQDTLGGQTDVFITKLNDQGNDLIYSSYWGEVVTENASGIAVDESGGAYIAGYKQIEPALKSTVFSENMAYRLPLGAFALKVSSIGPYICGDANDDGTINVSDAVFIINYVFAGGAPPNPYPAGDANCDDTVNISDGVWIINYIFAGGYAPCDTDGDGTPDC